LGEWWREGRPVHVFILKFVGVLLVLHLVTVLPLFDRVLRIYLHGIATVAAALTHCFGEPTIVTDTTMHSPTYAITVAPTCSAVDLACYVGAAVIAFPSPWRAKVSGFFLGVCLVVALNVVRITSLFLVGAHAHSAFDVTHEDIWAVLLIMASTVFVAGWIAWVTSRKTPAATQSDEYAAG
jgi:exosortase/archaeosortase family protein